jgi:ATP-dependent RNA helicase DeaD
MNDFEEFGLSAPVLESIHKMGFVEASPIQKKAIPLILEGRDLLGQAQTGTGKTAAFGIPMAERLEADAPHVGALVLCPTRELAVQVAEELHELCLFSGQKVLPIYGGQRIDRQITALKKGVQVVVGTPGRLLDHLGRRTLDLSGVQLLVLDEADMMLDMGFLPDIRRILRQCPTDRQTMLFSATIPDDIRRISQEYMRDPEWISVVPETLTLEDTEQIFYEVPEDEKIDALMRLLDYEGEEDSVIVFCRTRRNVDKLTRKLKSRGYDVEGLHGDLTQQQRDQIMHGFREQKFAYLVATDVASRGLDISHVTRVINFHIPQDPEAYVHRIGRTGRMGRSGVAITFVTPAEYWDLLRIQEFSMAQIEQGELPSSGEVEERRRAAAGDLTARRKVREADRAPGRNLRAVSDEAIIELTPAGLEAMASAASAGDEALGTPLGAPVETDEETPREPSRRRRRAGAGAAKDATKDTTETPAAEPFFTLPETGEDSTEAERRQRRYAMRDARKRIEWTAADEAVRESARIEDEALVDSAYGEAYDAETTSGDHLGNEGPTAAEREARTAAEAARRADVAERMREAEMALAAETPTPPEVKMATDEPLIEPQEELRIRRALRLRDQVRVLIEKLDLTDLGDMPAIVARLEMDYDLRTIAAALIKELAVRQGDLSEEAPQEQMTRLFLSIGRRAHVDRHDLERLVRETSGIEEEDIGRIDLLHNFAFLEVRKGVAEMVVEKMHESMFRGKEISVEPARSGGRGQSADD